MKNEDPWSYEKLIVRMLALVAIVITLTIGSCCIHIDCKIAKAIEQGNDPVAARIAFSNHLRGAHERLVYIVNKEK